MHILLFMKTFSNFLTIFFHLMHEPQCYFHPMWFWSNIKVWTLQIISKQGRCFCSSNQVWLHLESRFLQLKKNVQFCMENFLQPTQICICCPSSKSQSKVLIFNLFCHEIEGNICFAHVLPFYPFCSLLQFSYTKFSNSKCFEIFILILKDF